jgi:hypothetical protein
MVFRRAFVPPNISCTRDIRRGRPLSRLCLYLNSPLEGNQLNPPQPSQMGFTPVKPHGFPSLPPRENHRFYDPFLVPPPPQGRTEQLIQATERSPLRIQNTMEG